MEKDKGKYSLKDLAAEYERESRDKIEPTETDSYFPVMYWNIDKESMDLAKAPADLPAGQALVIVKTKCTGNDFILAERIRAAIEKSKMLQYVCREGYAV